MLETWLCDDKKISTATILAWAAEWNTPLYDVIPKFKETDSRDDADIRVEFTGELMHEILKLK